MKTNMTENDKKLLFILSVGVIIVAIGFWGIRPQVKRFNKLETMVEEQEEEKSINQLKIANVGMVEIQADEYEAKIAEKKDEFYQIMNSSEVDGMMTHMAIDKGLEIYDLKFSMPQKPSSRRAYSYSQLYKKQKALIEEYKKSSDDDDSKSSSVDTSLETDDDEDSKDSEKKSSSTKKNSKKANKQQLMEEITGDEEGGYQPNTDIYAVPVTMTVGGEQENLDSFIDSIINIDGRVLLVGYSWGQFREIVKRDSDGNIISSSKNQDSTDSSDTKSVSSEESSDVTAEVVTKKSLTVKLEIFMCDTSDIATSGDAVSETE